MGFTYVRIESSELHYESARTSSSGGEEGVFPWTKDVSFRIDVGTFEVTHKDFQHLWG